MRKPKPPPNWNELLEQKCAEDIGKVQRDPELAELLRRCESSYWPWQKLRFRVQGKPVKPEVFWLSAKISRSSRFKKLPLFGYDRAPLRFNVPDVLQHELMLIDQQLAGGLVSGDDSPPAESQREKFIINAIQEEAIASSMLEGAITTRQEAKQMLRAGRRPRSRGEQMVLNNYQAIQFIREHRNSPLSPEFLIELQRILTDKTLDPPDQVGRFRTQDEPIKVIDDRDGEILHVPPPASELADRLKALCDFGNRPPHGKDFIHPVIAACVLHFQLAFDHPFCDGNGRTARALFYWMMLHSGYWLFEYLPISRLINLSPGKYARAFLYTETDEFDVTYFLMYKARIIEKARQDLRTYIAAKQEHVVDARRLFTSDSRLNHRQRDIILHAARNPDRYFTIAEHQRQNGITYATSRTDFLNLVKWKYLKNVPVGKRFEFIAGPKISELER